MKLRLLPRILLVICIISVSILTGLFFLRRYLPHKEEKKTEKGTIICIGDSLTFGYGVVFNRLNEAWPYLLDEMLDDFEVLNYGISGATAAREARGYDESFLDKAIEQNAEIYFYMLGSNDAKNGSLDSGAFRSDTLKIVNRLINETDGQIIILLPPPVFEKNGKVNSFGIRNSVIESVIIPVLKEIADEYSLSCLSLYDLFKDKPQYFDDLVHPGKEGNQIIAEYIYENIFSNR